MYALLEQTDRSNVVGPVNWEETTVRKWLIERVQQLLGRSVCAEADPFQQGLDSLTATLLLRELKGALFSANDPSIQVIGAEANQETIFRRPSVEQLVRLIVRRSPEISSHNQDDSLEAIRKMIQNYTTDRPLEGLKLGDTDTEQIVLTGTTGSLESHLLAQLLQDDRVERVWAINRKSSSGDGICRQRGSFKDKGLDLALLESRKLVYLEGDLTEPGFQIGTCVLEEIQAFATAIIHNRWQVNFNLSLQSFEPSLKSAANLIGLAFRSANRPRFLFVSSLSSLGMNTPGVTFAEEYGHLEDVTMGFGYGESKFVAEKMMESACASGLETCIIRPGQLSGNKSSGSWSKTDWVPAFLASSFSVGLLPNATGSISWIPLDLAAGTIIDACLAREFILPPVINCTHPYPTLWSQAVAMFSQTLERYQGRPLTVVPFSEWNSEVKKAAATAGSTGESFKRFPSTKVQVMFDSIVRAEETVQHSGVHVAEEEFEIGGMPRASTKEAERLSERLRRAEPINQRHVNQWVAYWDAQGLFV